MACKEALDKINKIEKEKQEEMKCLEHRICPDCANDLKTIKNRVFDQKTLRLECTKCTYTYHNSHYYVTRMC